MNHLKEAEQEADPGNCSMELNEAAEADLGGCDMEREERHQLQAPSHHRRRQDNGSVPGGEGAVRPSRPCQQISRGTESASERQTHHHHAAPRYRRYDGSAGGGSSARIQRRSAEEAEAEQQQVQKSIPRSGVTRYRRQGDNEARVRAQQQRQRQRQLQQREAERVELPPVVPPPVVPPPPEHEDPEDDEGGASSLARSASTESGFHNHTDRPEGDAVMALEPEREDDSVYGVPFRPEAEEYTESAEAEQHGGVGQAHGQPQPHYPPQPPPLPREPLPHVERPLSQDMEALNPTYSSYVYTQQLYQGSGVEGRGSGAPDDEPYAEPYASYGMQEHVYEEIGDASPAEPEGEKETPQQRRAGFRLFEQDSYRQQEAVGSRLHHYDERSDGESDSPEKEAEFAPYPRMDSMDQEEDIDQIVAEVKESLSSQSLDRVAAAEEEWPESEHNSKGELPEDKPLGEEGEMPPTTSPSEDPLPQRHSREKRDAISLAIKDIKEAIEEVKTRTVRSPYTPDEPKEPIWVMRQDLSPTGECDLQPPQGGDSPGSGSTSPQGAGSSSRHPQLQESSDSFEASSPAGKESRKSLASFPTYVEVPGPCDPEDLIDGIIFAANYLGSTQLLSDKTPSKNVRMMQAQEAVSRIKTAQKLAKNRKKAPEGEAQPMTEVDLFISTQRIKVLNADSQETMMDHPLRTISYIADIGNIVVLMARRRMPRSNSQEPVEASDPAQDEKRQYKMICHVFESEDAQLIAQSIGQAFSVAYQEFLRANGINPEDLSQKEYSDLLNTQDMYNDDLIHFSKSENCKDVYIEKQKGEILGVVIVESGWGSILPTVIIANMMHAGPAEKSGRLHIGDQIMSINGTSLVGLPLSTCQSIIKGLKNQSRIKLNIVRCPPVTTVLIRRPDLRYQLGFSVQNGIICSLMRGGIAERGGVRVGHRIIEINGQSVVATPHEKIVHILSNAVGEIHMKTMPAAMYRLLTAQEQPVYI
ncbi:amyloid-beta A4 precursor protein-binding family A member 1 isoform X1 [Scleropages formosus]|uniref:Amyloid beta protein binding family A member 1 n=1 Tax=Scleropages formosus TaxID=113540 RepID=A0A8C9RMK3_SCLFO|nr:amyloid-beta A4 precursor protein-binding family A member 1 isoform X1 [Scleropages formosus]XP_018615559.2 amyloid-beta A4 precursor protein-binding family A member 1 isoform X1 [Scleropages formosus]XP_018615560.2 amyloid-beta A4 precursor protein-binding family A member 1 isoform X1 [Scleropages formosus]